ncbi:hypothetical protein [Cellulomonas oligotrophica]|uniref:Cardiolipin synthase N-terminal domain-containing protein n=1 Tax=Cellulomonas oligotrophica TaxID=931536 RepID=A0A7Y9JYW8_9CELL|nr:hypothetical protein [Cellulomonas oligotrophica]NYD87336.1 hypothetical protein [Cellulomonas oligotrophica]GIG34255.1 hypothetical protein Col01nite_34140 [Cellulomonas oligotrophica]
MRTAPDETTTRVFEGPTYGVDLLLPATYDIVWSVVVIGSIVLALVLAIVALERWRHRREDAGSAVVGALVILCVPVVGPLAYLYATRRPRTTAGTTPAP